MSELVNGGALVPSAEEGPVSGKGGAIAISSPRLVRLSPNGEFLASAQKRTLTIRVVATYEVHVHVRCSDDVQALAWSPDSELISCSITKRASVEVRLSLPIVVWGWGDAPCDARASVRPHVQAHGLALVLQVFAVRQPDWRCRIDEGVAGLVHSSWAPDSRHIVTVADFQIHMTLWSLTTQKTVVVQKPKAPQKAVTFSGSFMAVATRKDCKDSITVFDCDSWETVSTFQVKTSDLAAIVWNDDGSAIIAQDTCLRFFLVVYSTMGEVLREYTAYEHALGIRSLTMNPGGAFLAVASFDQSVRLLNSLSWEVASEYPHTHPKLLAQAVKCTGVRLVTEFRAPRTRECSKFVVSQSEDAFTVPTDAVVADGAATPKVGVSVVRWSYDGRYMATKNENMPRVLWVWDVSVGGLQTVIVLDDAVRCMAWSPTDDLLCFSTGGEQLYEWTPESVDAIQVDDLPQILTIQFTADGASVVLCSAKAWTCINIHADQP
jgi:WD40 repeat protein